MPKIPVYEQQVEMAAGSLGPRASSAAFEAPGQALASLGKQVSDTAYQFGMMEKKTQSEEAKNAAISEYLPKAQTLIDNPKSSTVSGFDIEAGAFKKDAVASVNARTDLTESQKRFVRNNLVKSIDSKMSIGRSKVFTIQQANRKNQAETAIGFLLDEAVTNPNMRSLTMKSIQDIIDNGSSDGLNLGWTRESVDLEIDKREILSETTDEKRPITYFQQQRDKILNGEGRGKGKNAATRQALSRMYDTHINYLKGPLTAEANAMAKNAIASMVIDGKGAKQGAKAVSMLRQAGQEALAIDAENQLAAAESTFQTVDSLTFSSPEQVNAARDTLRAEARAASGTDKASTKLLQIEQFEKAIQERQRRLDADPVGYIIENFKRKFTSVDPSKAPSADSIIVAQTEMGIPENQLRVFTAKQVNDFNTKVGQAQTPSDVDDVLIEFGLKTADGVTVSGEVTDVGMRQLRANGMSLPMNYVANSPDSPMSAVLLQSALPGAIEINVSPQNKDMLISSITTNESVATHLKSMLGGSFVDFQGNTIRAAAADTTGMREARQQHIKMLSDLTVYLIQKDGKSLSGDQRVDMGTIQTYIDQAATIFEERYSYIDNFPNENVSLRLPKTMAAKTGFIKQRLGQTVAGLKSSDIYFRPKREGQTTAEYDIERNVYLNEVKGGFGWTVSSDGKNAILLDKNAGAVIGSDGEPIVESLYDVLQTESVIIKQEKDAQKAAKGIQDEIRRLGAEAQDLTGLNLNKILKEQGSEARDAAIAKRQNIREQIKLLQDQQMGL